MTGWRKTDQKSKYGVALYNYNQEKPHRLDLEIGDTVVLLEENEGWYRGYQTKDKNKKGIFPKSYISLKDAVISMTASTDTVIPNESPIVQEVTNVLHEWHAMWKTLSVIRDTKREDVRDMLLKLIEWRSKIMSKTLTKDEIQDMQHKISSHIDNGDALLGLDLVVRDEDGNVLNPEKTSTVKLYQKHVQASERIKEQAVIETEKEVRPSLRNQFNLYVMLRNFVCRIGEDADILMNLYDAKHCNFISENYLVTWSKEGAPKDLDMLNNFRVVFTDMGIREKQREKIFLVFQIVRLGVMDHKAPDTKKMTTGLRRPFGVAAMDITEYIQGTRECSEENQIFIPFLQCGDKEFMESVVKKVIVAKEINHKGQGLWVSLKILHGDIKQVKEDYPHLILPGTSVARKMGFPEVIMPDLVNLLGKGLTDSKDQSHQSQELQLTALHGNKLVELVQMKGGDVRNDIYVSLISGEFTKGPAKTTDKNVEVTMQVCNMKGEVLKGVISFGCGVDPQSEYRSVIYYHEDRPKWYEIMKVAISTEEQFRGLHLRFTFKHRSSHESKDKAEKPFAMSFVKLMNENETTLADTIHELLVYKIEHVKRFEGGFYLDLPSSKKQLEQKGWNLNSKQQSPNGVLVLSGKDSFQISSFVCSTKLTHNVNVLGLLQWKGILHNSKALKSHLEHLMQVDGEEIVKFLQDLLDSLFNILMQNQTSEIYNDLVFDALVYIINLISDRKYHQFRPVLDAYIATTFSFVTADSKLIDILKDYIDQADEQSHHESLLRALKSMEYLFRFIIKSRVLYSACNEGRGKQQFELSLKNLIKSINGMMMYVSDHTVVLQGAALKYMCSTITDIISNDVFDPLDLSHLFVEFINNVPPDRLTRQKMKCIDDLVHSDLLKRQECRFVLLPMILGHTKHLLEKKEEMEECILVLCDIMDTLFLTDQTQCEEDISLIMKIILRTVIQTTVGLDRSSNLVGNCVAVMMSILRQMSERNYNQYINENFPMPIDLIDFLMEILMVFRDLVTKSVYQDDWLEMILLQNSVILRTLRFISYTIIEKFSNPFEQELWNNFFHCAISFLTQEPLQLENFSNSKRNKIISRYKDMRRETGFEIRSMWGNLGHNKINFIPEIVGPILEMTLIPEAQLRKATIPVFFDMMQCEFMHPTGNNEIQGHFKQVENEIITQLDAMVEGGKGDEDYVELIYQILYQSFDKHQTMRDQGLAFVETVKKLLERLMQYRLIIQDEVKEHRMTCIVNLLDFYHEIGRQELYIRYVHKLCDLHLQCDNYNEAAYALMLYAKLLNWSDDMLPLILMSDKYRDIHTHKDLKEKIYLDIIGYFVKGKMWEKGIELCKELASLYEEELYDYEKLSNILKKQAELYDKIMHQVRPDPEYFRVGYYGKGYPLFLQNKLFIYRGKEYERLSDFNQRMQMLLPNAELLKTLSVPSEEMKVSDKQYLQINAVKPVMELPDRFNSKHVNEHIVKYYKVNDVQNFTFDKRVHESTDDVSSMWLDRTNLTISYPLPGILCWNPVVATSVYKVSPLETAIDTLEMTNNKLFTEIQEHKADLNLKINSLSGILNGVCDPAVQGGLANYKIFFSDQFLEEHPDERDAEMVGKLRDLTVAQVRLLREALIIHKHKAPDNLMPLHQHLEHRFSELCSIIENQYGIRLEPDKMTVGDRGFFAKSLRRNTSVSGQLRLNDTYASNPEINSSSPTSKVSKTQSVWVKAEKDKVSGNSPSKSLGAKMGNMIKRASQVAEQLADPTFRISVEHPIELNEQLTPKRPLRADAERRHSRPNSSQFNSNMFPSVSSSQSNSSLGSAYTSSSRNSTVSGSDSTDGNDEIPPSLPEKKASTDHAIANTPDIATVMRAQSVQKNKPHIPLPVENDEPPPPPPKKPHPHR